MPGMPFKRQLLRQMQTNYEKTYKGEKMKINKRIPRFLKLDKNIFPSLRGDYQLVKNFRYFEFTEAGLQVELEK